MAAYPMPYGYRDANFAVLVMAITGEFVQGGLVFGWNALSLMLHELGFYEGGCGAGSDVIRENGTYLCRYQEEKLSVLWTVGIFALNFGPVLVGPILDYFGPKLTVLLGTLLNMIGLILIGCSVPGGFNALPAGAVILGLGGITYHLGNFHISNLFPRKRGLVSSLFVAGFTGCGIVFYILQSIFEDLGSSRHDFRGAMIVYAFFCALWMPLNIWMMPWSALAIGETYVFTKSWRFKPVQRSEVQSWGGQEVAMTDKEATMNGVHGPAIATNGHVIQEEHQEAFNEMGLIQQPTSSSDPRWAEDGASTPRRRAQAAGDSPLASPHSMTEISFRDSPKQGDKPKADAPPQERLGPSRRSGVHEVLRSGSEVPPSRNTDLEAAQRPHGDDVVWGPLVFEARRFVELRKRSLWDQFKSAESFGMGLFYTANVFCIQFYLGTTHLQLEHKGDSLHHYTNFANIIVSFGFVGIPVIGWLLDKKGYGITLGTINFLGVLCSVLQAIPSLQLQVVTLIIWAAGRFFLYSSYFAIFGALFGFKNFGKMVAIDNTFNGLIGILQLPLTWWGVGGLRGNFTVINILQAVILLPLFLFCIAMYKWERHDLVPIRPMEGAELPLNMHGPRQLRQAQFVQTLKTVVPVEG